MRAVRGRAWKLGDGIDTDMIIPARYLALPLGEMKHRAMEPLLPDFAGAVSDGDVIVAGRNFGCGSSREQAPAVLRELGIRAIVAVSFARIFFRNAINLGVPPVECPEAYEHVRDGDLVEVDPLSGRISMVESEKVFEGSRLPDFMIQIVDDGGLIPHLLARQRSG